MLAHKNREHMGKWQTDVQNAISASEERIELPDVFSLADNYDGVVSHVNRIRAAGKKRIYIDFDSIENVGASAALMLAAEMEVRKIQSGIEYLSNDSQWNPNVRDQLRSMGIFRLLKVRRPNWRDREVVQDEVFVKFASCSRDLDGNDHHKIIRLSENVRPGCKIPETIKAGLWGGLGEAMTNARDHAYGKKIKEKTSRWWVSASVNKNNGTIKVICYDRGLTIPGTIRTSDEKREKILKIIRREGGDQNIIYAAMLERTSSTKEKHRGRGLGQLIQLINDNKQGILEIYSRRGMVRYEKTIDLEEGKYTTAKMSSKLHGTLVVWSIIPSQQEE